MYGGGTWPSTRARAGPPRALELGESRLIARATPRTAASPRGGRRGARSGRAAPASGSRGGPRRSAARRYHGRRARRIRAPGAGRRRREPGVRPRGGRTKPEAGPRRRRRGPGRLAVVGGAQAGRPGLSRRSRPAGAAAEVARPARTRSSGTSSSGRGRERSRVGRSCRRRSVTEWVPRGRRGAGRMGWRGPRGAGAARGGKIVGWRRNGARDAPERRGAGRGGSHGARGCRGGSRGRRGPPGGRGGGGGGARRRAARREPRQRPKYMVGPRWGSQLIKDFDCSQYTV